MKNSNNLVTFTLILRDDERQEIMRSFSRLLEALRKAVPVVESQISVESAAPAVTAPLSAASAAPESQKSSLPAPRDRWGLDKNGKELSHAENEIEAYTVRLWQLQDGVGKFGPYVAVRWEQRRAYCHAQNLFPWIVAAYKEKKQIVLYLKEKDGNYQHIVGVRA